MKPEAPVTHTVLPAILLFVVASLYSSSEAHVQRSISTHLQSSVFIAGYIYSQKAILKIKSAKSSAFLDFQKL
jgi:hypothetical protein